MGIRQSIVATIVAAIVIGIATEYWGSWSNFALSIKVVAITCIDFLNSNISIPIWIAIVTVTSLTICLLYIFLKRHQSSFATEVVEASFISKAKLSENENNVVMFLAAADGRLQQTFKIAEITKKSILETEQSLEKLLNKDFLEQTLVYGTGMGYRLSPRGRDYAIENGYHRKIS